MRLQVVHETHYSYSSPVELSQQLLHLTPRPLPWQVRHAHRISIDPAPGEYDERDD
ncbi:MAG: transglutaminase N-terminal domain-containing protein, partial [Burkholderiales bacterium]